MNRYIDPVMVKKLASLAFQFDEIAGVFDVNPIDLKPYEKLVIENWPNDSEFKRIRRKRLVKWGIIKGNAKIISKLRQRIKGQIAEMISREMGDVESLMGYSLEDLKEHLEKSFTENMSWENSNKWHIDHIKPRSSFKVIEIKECFKLDNLKPIWSIDNLKKGSSYG